MEFNRARKKTLHLYFVDGTAAPVRGVHPPAGLSGLQREQVVLSFVGQQGRFQRADLVALSRLSGGHAKMPLKRPVASRRLLRQGSRRGSFDTPSTPAVVG